MRIPQAGRTVGVLSLTAVLVASACSGAAPATTAPTQAPATTAPSGAPPASVAPSEAAAPAVCEGEKVGPVTRCENFYEDFWPTISANMDNLYEQAKGIDGSQLVVWDWFEVDPAVIAEFNKKYPDLKVVTQGFTYQLSSAIVTAKETAQRSTDYITGTFTLMEDRLQGGYFDEVDWSEVGLPAEFVADGVPQLVRDSVNGSLIQYNTTKVQSVPTNLEGFLAPEWKDRLGIASFNARNFAGYGMANGQEAMVKLINDLKANGLVVSDKAGDLLSSGDLSAVLGGELFNPSPDLAVGAFDDSNVFFQHGGVNAYGTNKPGAMLWALWIAYDPDWLAARATQEQFATESDPFPGLPSSVFDEQTGLRAKNHAGWAASMDIGVWETFENRVQYATMINAAQDALTGS